MRNERLVVSRDKLLEEVWDYHPYAETNTIDVFVSNLRRKLEAGGEPRVLHTVRGSGYVLRPDGVSGRARTALRRTRLRLPIRLKLAVVSAGLTFVILLLFALVVGALTEQQLRRASTTTCAPPRPTSRSSCGSSATSTGEHPHRRAPRATLRAALPAGPRIRVVDRQRHRRRPRRPPRQPRPPGRGRGPRRRRLQGGGAPAVRRVAGSQRQLRPRSRARSAAPVAFVQYAKPRANVQGTIDRLRFFLASGHPRRHRTGLPRRLRRGPPRHAPDRRAHAAPRARWPAPATRPVAAASPEANDEVAELADTLEDMLASSTPPGRRPRPRWCASGSSWPTPPTSCAPR